MADRELIEHLTGNGTLALDGTKVLQVRYDIKIYRKYKVTQYFGGSSRDPAGIAMHATVWPLDIEAPFIPCGRETNILDIKRGSRQIDINAPELYIKGQSFTFTASHSEMNFFDTPLYREE